jgi:hypothetical protein
MNTICCKAGFRYVKLIINLLPLRPEFSLPGIKTTKTIHVVYTLIEKKAPQTRGKSAAPSGKSRPADVLPMRDARSVWNKITKTVTMHFNYLKTRLFMPITEYLTGNSLRRGPKFPPYYADFKQGNNRVVPKPLLLSGASSQVSAVPVVFLPGTDPSLSILHPLRLLFRRQLSALAPVCSECPKRRPLSLSKIYL